MSNEDKVKRLRELMGKEAYEQLCDELGGENIYISAFLRGYANITERNEAIRQDYYNGMLPHDIADKWQLSVSHIYKILERWE